MKACILDIDAAKYHADRLCAEPTLSASIACILCNDSPAHAKARHPRLTENPVREEAEHFDIGTIAHALLLEGVNKAEVLDFSDWRTKAAREAREAVRDAGKVPILASKWADVQAMVQAAREQLSISADARDAFVDGNPEQTILWNEGSAICRARLDWLSTDRLYIWDYKTTNGSANPDTIARTMFQMGWDVQAAFYIRAVQAVTGKEPRFTYACQETFPPYALSIIGIGPDVLMIGQKKVQWAIDAWIDCLNSGTWPAYPSRICYPELPPYVEGKWLEKELRA